MTDGLTYLSLTYLTTYITNYAILLQVTVGHDACCLNAEAA